MKQLFRNLLMVGVLVVIKGYGQEPDALIRRVKEKLDQVNDYEATGEMKTNVSFLKVPDAQVKVFFKKPGKLKIKNVKGISLVPKSTVSISLNNLLAGKYQALDAGRGVINGQTVRILKLLPTDETSEIVISTLYIDAVHDLILKAKTTTRESGTYELEMSYGKYAAFALPDRVIYTFNAQEYKLPKGVTFDYDDGSQKKKTNNLVQSQQGKIVITYFDYSINKGLSDQMFK